MIAKKYFSAIIILLTLLGFYKEQVPAPNQEIELQFTNGATTVQQTATVIRAITTQLEASGVENIQIRQQAEGTLKIAYFSNDKVAAIKELLENEGLTSNPIIPKRSQGNTVVTFLEATAVDSYKIDVYELQTASNPYFGMEGKFILALQKDYDKSPSPNSFANTNSFIIGDLNTTIEFVYTVSNYIAIPKENIAYETPDVRAGPFTAILS